MTRFIYEQSTGKDLVALRTGIPNPTAHPEPMDPRMEGVCSYWYERAADVLSAVREIVPDAEITP